MLVLTRKQQETIRIGQDVTITILRIKGNSIQLGIDAPRAVRVIRGELSERPCTTEAPPRRADSSRLGQPTRVPRIRPRGVAPLARQLSRHLHDAHILDFGEDVGRSAS